VAAPSAAKADCAVSNSESAGALFREVKLLDRVTEAPNVTFHFQAGTEIYDTPFHDKQVKGCVPKGAELLVTRGPVQEATRAGEAMVGFSLSPNSYNHNKWGAAKQELWVPKAAVSSVDHLKGAATVEEHVTDSGKWVSEDASQVNTGVEIA
jgi:hypothetical protein